MKNPIRTTGATIAFAAAALFATACSKDNSESSSSAPAATDKMSGDKMSGEMTAKVHCQGVNACKGQGSCKSASNACAGQNGCKGKGFVEVASKDDCTAKGGTVMAM